VWITYRCRGIWSARRTAAGRCADAAMVSRRPGDAERVYASVSTYPGIIRTIWRWRSCCPAAQAVDG
jgi:hypothetical protein